MPGAQKTLPIFGERFPRSSKCKVRVCRWAVHGACRHSLSTTFTASQGLLLMIPNMYKIAGELTPTVFHIAARSLAAQALSILATILTLCQLAIPALPCCVPILCKKPWIWHDRHSATLKAPAFMHFFDGFRTSHEVAKLMKSAIHYQAVISDEDVMSFRNRAESDPLSSEGLRKIRTSIFRDEKPAILFMRTPQIVEDCMTSFTKLTGRKYSLFDYVGSPMPKSRHYDGFRCRSGMSWWIP